MVRTPLKTMLNFVVVVYLVTHGVSVPAEGQADLVSGFCCATRAWLESRLVDLSALLDSRATLAGA
ncbi:MAG TPA: hypothetical protein VGT00_16110 [Methylomirabilota bacterium]|jgi:hypothetical protein|nr:hypothetical protein [Methylomirabilota bacterium]